MKRNEKSRMKLLSGENYVIFSEVIKNHNCFAYLGKYSVYGVGQ